MLIATRLPADDHGPDASVADPSAILAEILGSLVGTVLFHATADLDEIEATDVSIERLIDRFADQITGVALDIGGGVAVIEVTVRRDPRPTGARSSSAGSRDVLILGPARRSVSQQIDEYLAEHGEVEASDRLRIVIDAP